MTADKEHVRQFVAIFESAQVKLAKDATAVERAMTEVIVDLLQVVEKHAIDEAIAVLEAHPKCMTILHMLRIEETLAGPTQEH